MLSEQVLEIRRPASFHIIVAATAVRHRVVRDDRRPRKIGSPELGLFGTRRLSLGAMPGVEDLVTCVEIKILRAFVLNRRVVALVDFQTPSAK